MLNPSGQLVGVIGVSADISDIKRKEGKIRALNAALEERLVERTEQLQRNNEALRREWRRSCLRGAPAAMHQGEGRSCHELLHPPSLDLEQLSSRISQQTLVLERMVAELRESRMEAESANRLKSWFLASMSHENRTPMHDATAAVDAAVGGAAWLRGDDPQHGACRDHDASAHEMPVLDGI
ncbi:unnamed protein product [Closterium sp. Yama58-4]|nr:unnamed protein product [Closterium sp. Yama58-4]